MKALKTFLTSRELALLLLLGLISLGFSLADASFRDPANLLDRSRHWVEIGLIAIPMTFIIATGGIDLSVGSLLALSGIVFGLCFQNLHWSLAAALAAGTLTGVLGGTLNGVGVSLLRIPPLVVTLGTMALFRGLAMGLSRANPIRSFPESFSDWAGLDTLGWGDYQFPYQLLILIALVIVGEAVMSRTLLGRRVTQIGENERAAVLCAVPLRRIQFTIYAASGLTCGLAGMIYTARFATAHPASGAGLELEVIACVVIGGTRITGGNGSVLCTFFGVLLFGLLRFGMDMRGVEQQNQIMLIGALVVVLAILNEAQPRLRQLRGRRPSPVPGGLS